LPNKSARARVLSRWKRHTVPNSDVIVAGQRLQPSAWRSRPSRRSPPRPRSCSSPPNTTPPPRPLTDRPTMAHHRVIQRRRPRCPRSTSLTRCRPRSPRPARSSSSSSTKTSTGMAAPAWSPAPATGSCADLDRADQPHGLVAIRRRRAAIGRHPRRGKYRNEPPLYPHTPWPEFNEARFTCWLCTPVPGDEVPLRFRPWDAAPARTRGDYYRG
jgi:hypothetical protein